MPFEKGHDHGRKRRKFEQAIDRILIQNDGAALRRVAQKVWDLAEEGERWACEMLRDTLDGKPAQQLIATDADGKALTIGLVAYGPDPGLHLPAPVRTEALPAPSVEGTVRRH